MNDIVNRGIVWHSYKQLMQLPPPRWLISQHIIEAGVMFIYGHSQSSKTFFTIDLGLRLALMSDWFGLPIKQNVPVRYFAIEDFRGVSMRVDGWCKKHGFSTEETDEEFLVAGLNINLDINNSNSVDNFIKTLGDFKDGVIVIDTFNRICGGADENSSALMGKAISELQRIGDACNSLIIVVHHTGKDGSKGMRGSSALHAACDMVFRVEKHSNEMEVKFEKIKNSVDGHGKSYKLESIALDMEHYQDEHANTAVVIPIGDTVSAPNVVKITGDNNRDVYRILSKYLKPFLNKEDDYDTVVDAIALQWVEKIHEPRRKDLVKRSIKSFRKVGLVGTGSKDGRHNRIWMIEKEGIHVKY